MNATNVELVGRASVLQPGTSRWTTERELVRQICVQRSRAGFLAARLLELETDLGDAWSFLPAVAGDAEETRNVLRPVIQEYVRLLVQLGESRDAVLRLVQELPLEAKRSSPRADDALLESLHHDLTRWAAQTMTAD
jgi:hypothetical protein